jgi:glycosyltransferase involved in cell wall biosynthesis
MDVPVHKLAKSLSNNGYDVCVLEWDRCKKYLTNEAMDGSYSSHRFRFRAPKGKIDLLFYLPIWWLYEFYFLIKEDADIIHVCDFDTILPAIIVKFIRKIKLCYTIYDFYSDFPGKIPTWIRKIILFSEKKALKFVDILFMVNEAMYQELQGSEIKKVIYIYNTPNDYPIEKRRSIARDFPQCLRLFYAGWLTKPRGLKYMVDSIRDLCDVKLIIAGDGPDKDVLDKDLIVEGKLEYLGWIPYDEVIRRELEADILFFFYDPSLLNGKYSSPNKLFEAMMCGKPILANDGMFMSRIVSKEDCGIIVPFGDVESIKRSILKLRDNPILRISLGQNGRNAYEERYSWEIMERRLLNAYKSLYN